MDLSDGSKIVFLVVYTPVALVLALYVLGLVGLGDVLGTALLPIWVPLTEHPVLFVVFVLLIGLLGYERYF